MENKQAAEREQIFGCNVWVLVGNILLMLVLLVPFVFQDYSKMKFDEGFLIYCGIFLPPLLLNIWWMLWLLKLKLGIHENGFTMYSLHGNKKYLWEDIDKMYQRYVANSYFGGYSSNPYVTLRLIDKNGKKLRSTQMYNKPGDIFDLLYKKLDIALKNKMEKKLEAGDTLDLGAVTLDKKVGVKKKARRSEKIIPLKELSNYKLEGNDILVWGSGFEPVKINYFKTANANQFCTIISEIIRKNSGSEKVRVNTADELINEKPETGVNSLFFRSLIALVFFVGFYVLSLSLAGFLIFFGYLSLMSGKLHIQFILFCAVGAGAIIYSIIPRIKRFVKPGILLNEKENPKLFSEITKISKALKQKPPSEVYLVPDYNAFVTSRGGIMGIGSRRVMGIGLPLFHTHSVSELNSVIAHEFGHYYSGDVGLGPWIYNTREAVLRTYLNMQKTEHITTLIFRWYATKFLKITAKISRQQEYSADRLSAELTGSNTAAGQMLKLEKCSIIFNGYNDSDFFPVLSKGYSVPYMEGFQMYLKSDEVSKKIEEQINNNNIPQTSVYDSHPPTKERIAYIKQLNKSPREHNNAPAIELLKRPEVSEKELVEWICKNNGIKNSIEWKDVFEKVWLELWKERVTGYKNNYGEDLLKKTPAELVKLKDDKSFYPLGVSVSQEEADYKNAVRNAEIIGLVGTMVSLTMYKNGWTLTCNPGEPVLAKKEGKVFEPFTLISKIVRENKDGTEFTQMWESAGIQNIDCVL